MSTPVDWHQSVRVGLTGQAQEHVTPELTVSHRLPGMPTVYTTPNMIYLMEIACANAIHPHLPSGWTSLGVGVNIRHLAATPVGAQVRAHARIVEVTPRIVTCEVTAHDGQRLIGQGTHSRAPMNQAEFERSVTAQRAAGDTP